MVSNALRLQVVDVERLFQLNCQAVDHQTFAHGLVADPAPRRVECRLGYLVSLFVFEQPALADNRRAVGCQGLDTLVSFLQARCPLGDLVG